jgi:dTDP-4-dehydrorhamnose reductase
MLGSAVLRVLRARPEWNVQGTQADDPSADGYMDIVKMPSDEWKTVLQSFAPDYVVNCVGILKTAVNENDAASLQRAIKVNALFPHQLAELLPAASIINMSTDGVFSGAASKPYVETDATDCPDAYGKSKALGECPASNVINVRCSIIGRDRVGHKGLIEWVLAATPGAELPGFENHIWNGVSTTQFAGFCERVIDSGSFGLVRRTSSVHHFCPNPPISKYELLGLIQEASGKDITVRKSAASVPHRRVLGTVFNELRGLYPDSSGWLPVLREALSDS